MRAQVYVTPDTMMGVLTAGALGSAQHDNSDPSQLERAPFDWVLDAIDSLTPKQLLIAAATAVNLPVVSSMGAGVCKMLTMQLPFTLMRCCLGDSWSKETNVTPICECLYLILHLLSCMKRKTL
jgi:hypothetical protein